MNTALAPHDRTFWRVLALEVLAEFDFSHPGRGLDSHTGDRMLDHSMAYALFASSAQMLGQNERASAACEWLEKDAMKPGGEIGWGLPFEWDAFADGSPNPIHTIYGITTSLGVKALIDCSPGGEYLGTAEAALESYLKNSADTEAGLYFWYSNQADDAKSVYNVTAMLAGQYARLGRQLGRQDFIEAATKAAADLLDNRREGRNGYYWSYGEGIDRSNDAVHAAYTAQGALEIQRWLGIDIGVQFALMYLRKFFRHGMAYEFVRHDEFEKTKKRLPARPWGIGMLLYTACESPDVHLRSLAEDALAAILADDQNDNGLKSKVSMKFPRQRAHLALGLARAAQE